MEPFRSSCWWRYGRGVVQAAAQNAGHRLEMVNNQRWKARIIEHGGADKGLIGKVLSEKWPEAYALADGDIDLIDAAAINMYGRIVITNRKLINRRIKG